MGPSDIWTGTGLASAGARSSVRGAQRIGHTATQSSVLEMLAERIIWFNARQRNNLPAAEYLFARSRVLDRAVE